MKDFILGIILIINLLIGLGYMYVRYEDDFSIFYGLKAFTFAPIWFIFPLFGVLKLEKRKVKHFAKKVIKLKLRKI